MTTGISMLKSIFTGFGVVVVVVVVVVVGAGPVSKNVA